ncbi:sensor histidine kinase [Dyadobacter sp. 3J3]|uniref:sensor histidine kinase n=1 Tax=Dyadobacter sp. 3J3 TaxID=2606600 RepID=UPI00135A6D06|nr:histidine kinase [Dyadobacter sp. 3J3]
MNEQVEIPQKFRLISLMFSRQKWALAAGIVCIYLPIRIFISNDEFNTAIFLNKAPFWSIEFLVNLIFFRLWIGMIELIHRFIDWIEPSFAMRLPRQLFTYVTGLFLAILFNIGFIFFWIQMSNFYSNEFGINIQRSSYEKTPFARRQRTKSNTGLTVMAMIATIYMVSVKKSNEHLEQARTRAERLEKENLQTRFLALKNQLSPHFLFNSLSILTSLIEKNPQQSVIYVNRLSRSYRYILEHSQDETVTLKKELNFIEAYVFLLKSRFEEKLEVIVDIPVEYQNQFKIAPLTLQLLIENAVKHNQMSAEQPLQISIVSDKAYLTISNPIHRRKQDIVSIQVGLKNVVRRYALLTKNPVAVKEENGCFTVKIPLLT